MSTEVLLDENAKNDWLDLVKKHRKKQKGLPALSVLNKNAGNVEHNIAMFNKMNSGEQLDVNPMNGTTSEPAGMGESIELKESDMNEEKVILEYHDLPVDVETSIDGPSGYYDRQLGGWVDTRKEAATGLVDWDFQTTKNDIIEFLQDDEFVQGELWTDDITGEEFDMLLEQNFDAILDKFMRLVKDHFYYDAIEQATEYYSTLEEDYEEMPHTTSVISEDIDDRFDMSLRTLL